MIGLSRALMGLTVAAALSGVVVLIIMMVALDRRGQKTSLWMARVRPDKYVRAYREAIRAERGRPGRLAGLWKGLWIAALVFAAAALLARMAAGWA
jgi:hypothetical protein